MNYMLDTNIYDKLVVDHETCALVSRLQHLEFVKIYITSVQLNEILAIPDLNKKNLLLILLAELSPRKIPVELAPYGYAYGECYGGISPDAVLDHEKFMTSEQHVNDAMIFATASSNKYKIDIIVTDDGRFTKKVKAQNLITTTMNYEAFKRQISSMTY